jgi:hypothetical protein
VEELADVPTAVWVLVGVGVAGMVATLVDLAFHDVKQLPKGVWAAIIVLVSFPIGAILYLTVGRVAGPRGAATLAPARGSAAVGGPPPSDGGAIASTSLLEVAPAPEVTSPADLPESRPTIVSGSSWWSSSSFCGTATCQAPRMTLQ